ncbi:Hypothetical predicted protein [Pelobates cultripes]|uniref:Uncharacterized protein n=1 Tax=Pelobates cultripes TaxID=61616 RepID=A0AAD1VT39_PELCU|nr:Hypothetical predicted protein [Pelobates cultripes]
MPYLSAPDTHELQWHIPCTADTTYYPTQGEALHRLMPFRYPTGRPLPKRKATAYLQPPRFSLESLLGGPLVYGAPGNTRNTPPSPLAQEYTMGRRSQKPEGRDIGAMLQKPQQGKASQTGDNPDTASSQQPQQPEEAQRPEPNQTLEELIHPPQVLTGGSAPATKDDLKALLTDLHRMMAADRALAQKKIQAVATKVQATEGTIWCKQRSLRSAPRSSSSKVISTLCSCK